MHISEQSQVNEPCAEPMRRDDRRRCECLPPIFFLSTFLLFLTHRARKGETRWVVIRLVGTTLGRRRGDARRYVTRVLKTRDERFVSAAYGSCRSGGMDDKPTRGDIRPLASVYLWCVARPGRAGPSHNGFARCARNAGFNRHRVRGIDDRWGILPARRSARWRDTGYRCVCTVLTSPSHPCMWRVRTRPSLHKQRDNFRKFAARRGALFDRINTLLPMNRSAHPGADGSLRATVTCNKALVTEFVTSRPVDDRDNWSTGIE